MRHLRWALLAATILALSASSPAVAANHPDHGGGAVVLPSNGHISAELLKTLLQMPADVNPRWGTGDDPCVRFGPHGKILSAISFGEVTCTAELGTVLTTGMGHFCTDFDPVDSPFFAVGRKAQRRCARAVSDEQAVKVIVDGRTVDILKPRFEVYSPLTSVQMPPGNAFSDYVGPGTFTSFGWEVLVRNLRVGRHVITTVVTFGDGVTVPFHHYINIVPRHHR